MLPSRFAAFICLTLASLATAECFYGDLRRDKDTYTLYLYKGYHCTGTVLKHKSKPVDGVCRNLPVPTKNKKGQSEGPNWNDRVKSLNIILPLSATFRMFRDQGCKNEYGQTLGGSWHTYNMTDAWHVFTEPNSDDKSFQSEHVNLGGMSSYLVTHMGKYPILE